MPILSTMGLKKIFLAEANAADASQMPENGSNWADLGDVYQDTCTLKDADPTVTVHKSETSNKKISMSEPGDTTVELSLMDPDLNLLAKYFGGTITGSAGARKWIRPRKLPYKEWAIKLLPEEGVMVQCPCVTIVPKFEITYSAKGICLVPMVITLQEQLNIDEAASDPTVPVQA
jgi:hypothetical protein